MIRIPFSEHLAMETEGERSPIQVDPILAAQQQIDEAWWMKVMRMTARRFAELSPVEKRLYAQRARQLAKTLDEKANMFERNSRPDPELPARLRARG